MRSEQDCPPGQRVLPALCTLEITQLSTKSILSNYPKIIETPEALSYLAWSLGPNDLVLYSGYAWYDTPIPREYNFLFDRYGTGRQVGVQILHALADWIYPLDSIVHGWKTAYVARFSEGIPEELNFLRPFTNTSAMPLRFAFCMSQDKDEITEYFRQIELNPDDIG